MMPQNSLTNHAGERDAQMTEERPPRNLRRSRVTGSNRRNELRIMVRNMRIALRKRYPGCSAIRWSNRTQLLRTEDIGDPRRVTVEHALWLLDKTIPEYIDRNMLCEANERLGIIRGMLLGLGDFTMRDVYYIGYD